MSSKDKKLQKLTERDHVSRHSMCVCVFTLFQMGRWALYDPLKKLFFYFYKAFKTFPLFIFFFKFRFHHIDLQCQIESSFKTEI
jgi:hypothetical protein